MTLQASYAASLAAHCFAPELLPKLVLVCATGTREKIYYPAHNMGKFQNAVLGKIVLPRWRWLHQLDWKHVIANKERAMFGELGSLPGFSAAQKTILLSGKLSVTILITLSRQMSHIRALPGLDANVLHAAIHLEFRTCKVIFIISVHQSTHNIGCIYGLWLHSCMFGFSVETLPSKFFLVFSGAADRGHRRV